MGNERIRELSLFSGAGGGLLGSILLGWQTIGAVEIADYCCKVLRQRQIDGCLERFPVWNMDIREFNTRIAERYRGVADIITAGFPCQPFSLAGKRKGETDERNLWPATIDTISIVKPRHILLENVPGIRRYLPMVIRGLRRAGYTVKRPAIIAAAALGAGHIRRRIWIYANDDAERCADLARQPTTETLANVWPTVGVGDGKRKPGCRGSWWSSEPDVVRVVYGMAHGLVRLRALGNGQVPRVVSEAVRLMAGNYNRVSD